MKYKSLNEKNKNLMNSEMNNDLNFEWEDAYLLDEIIRKYDDLYPFSSDPQEFINDKYYLSEINRLFNSLFIYSNPCGISLNISFIVAAFSDSL